MIEPTPGRIVYYYEGKTMWPAMVVGVYDKDPRMVDLKVFTDANVYSRPRTQLLQDEDKASSPHWAEWMPYQKGQAAKSDTEIADLKKQVEDLTKVVDGLTGHSNTVRDQIKALEASVHKTVADALGPVSKGALDGKK